MPAHIALVACLKQAQKNKGNKKPLKLCLLRHRRIALIYINFLLRRKAHSYSFFYSSPFLERNPRAKDGVERQINVGQKEFINSLLFLHINFAQMSHNVPAVTDVFLRPIRKNAEHFYGRKKMWRNKTVQRAKPEHGFV